MCQFRIVTLCGSSGIGTFLLQVILIIRLESPISNLRTSIELIELNATFNSHFVGDCQDRKTQNLFGFKGLAVLQSRYLVITGREVLNTSPPLPSLPMDLSNLTADAIVGTWFLSDTEDRQNGLTWYNNAHAISERIAQN